VEGPTVYFKFGEDPQSSNAGLEMLLASMVRYYCYCDTPKIIAATAVYEKGKSEEYRFSAENRYSLHNYTR
jgi:hypothetical protein